MLGIGDFINSIGSYGEYNELLTIKVSYLLFVIMSLFVLFHLFFQAKYETDFGRYEGCLVVKILTSFLKKMKLLLLETWDTAVVFTCAEFSVAFTVKRT